VPIVVVVVLSENAHAVGENDCVLTRFAFVLSGNAREPREKAVVFRGYADARGGNALAIVGHLKSLRGGAE
jgi:hypothetical protein